MIRAEIHEVLARAGVEIRSGRMICPRCGDRKLTANTSRGIAKCWGCERFWTTDIDPESKQAWDWATALMTPLAELCKSSLASDGDARMWLLDRGLPIDDLDWIYEQDLGSVPRDLESQLRPHLYRAEQQLAAEIETLKAEIQRLQATQAGSPGRPRKELQLQVQTLTMASIDTQNTFNHLKKNILPLLEKLEWVGAVVYVYRDEEGNVTSLNIRQIASEYTTDDHRSERRVIRIQPRANHRGLFGADDAQYALGEAWSGEVVHPIVVEGEHNLLSLRAHPPLGSAILHPRCRGRRKGRSGYRLPPPPRRGLRRTFGHLR
jgi:hypothetical protein